MRDDTSYIERLRWLRERDRLENAAEAARAYGMNANTFKSVANGTRNLTSELAERVAHYHRVSPGWLMFGEGNPDGRDVIPISGYVAAGQAFHPFDTQGETGQMIPLSLGGPEITAVEVRGDSMLPVYRSGDIVLAGPFSRSLEAVLGDECLVWLEDGRRFLKIVEKGGRPGTVTLISWNAEPIRDVAMHSAGPVLGVRRSRHHVRRLVEMAKKVNGTSIDG